MERLLVVISRIKKNSEFSEFWGFSESRPQYFPGDGSALLILNGADHAENLLTYHTDKIIAEIKKKCDKELLIGVIYHNVEQDDFNRSVSQAFKNPSLAFVKSYSSEDTNFFDEQHKKRDFQRPLNKLCRSVRHGLNAVLFKEGFDAVWNYKGCDNTLEAKLELLCLLARNKGVNKCDLWEQVNRIAPLTKYKTSWEIYLADENLSALSNAIFEVEPKKSER